MNIFDTAEYILKSVGGELSAQKLQKLCWYSQAWTLAWDNIPLFNEDFVRHDFGPVCKNLSDIFREHCFVDSSLVPESLLTKTMTDRERRNINQVTENYGRLSGTDLTDLTRHQRPWKITPPNQIIPKEVVKKYYLGLIKKEVTRRD